MSLFELNIPRVVSVTYKQDDESTLKFGCCTWARFYFDLDNYSVSIESDCGSYGYSWARTPDFETFLHLCSRLDYDYLLEKFSSKTILDRKMLESNLTYLVEQQDMSDELDAFKESNYDLLKSLQDICYSCSDAREFVENVEYEIRYTPLEGVLENYDIWECAEYDYPINAKTICNIFIKEIIPWLASQECLKHEFEKN